ncbi:hypothetical protein [Legionella resiliens]|uniref:Transmembrane protein n=1 Tax=Legionella resiliens TaxID=2905958 RepID=A0ABS8X2Z2_9GAMM|nr:MULTISPECIES: hypothetical protein [unclassified Legionella]MCE0723978.1 hypothetical protein [Legionella sp. 9fVS26]MCE3533131.1 hypothetical protein [Legionella sp. 8cVS16]
MTKKKQEDDTNYTFLLRCMAALTAAAIVTAGVIAAVTLKSAAAATTAALATNPLLASAFIFTPILPIALVAIGLVFVLPFLFSCNNNTYTTVRTTAAPGYSSYSFYSPLYTTSDPYYDGHYDTGTTVYVNNDHSHGHPSSRGAEPSHDDGHMHEHGGSHRHGHF